MTPLAAAQAEVDQVTDIMKDNVGKVRRGERKKFCQPSRPITNPPNLHSSFQFTPVINNFGIKSLWTRLATLGQL